VQALLFVLRAVLAGLGMVMWALVYAFAPAGDQRASCVWGSDPQTPGEPGHCGLVAQPCMLRSPGASKHAQASTGNRKQEHASNARGGTIRAMRSQPSASKHT
jgi:hypothetical protein